MPPKLKTDNMADRFEGLRSDYSAAKASRFRRRRVGVRSMGSGADYHYVRQADFLRILEDARDMDRNDVIVGQTIDRAVTNTIQDGFIVDPKTGDAGADVALFDRWQAWGDEPEECDIAGESSFYDHENLSFRHSLADGDCLELPTEEGSLQLVEAHRLRTPSNTKRNVIHGVLLNERRKRIEYWLTKEDVDPLRGIAAVGDMIRYPTRDADGNRQVFHVYNPKRATQTRGVTALAPIFDVCGMFEDIQFARLVQQQVVSCFTVFRQLDIAAQSKTMPQAGDRIEQILPLGGRRTLEGISPGMEIVGEPGEELKGFTPNVPNPEFFDHIRLILTLIGINLGLPLVMVLLDASETNFSGWRGAVDQARMGFRRNQRALINRFHRPAYRWKVRQWLTEDPGLAAAARKTGVNIFGHQWNPPTWPYVDPLKDASADLLRQRNALSSPRRIQAERGRDWDEIANEIVNDNAYAIIAAKTKAEEINKRFPNDPPVHWRELVSLPTPDGIQITLNSVDEGAASSAGPGKGTGASKNPNQPAKKGDANG